MINADDYINDVDDENSGKFNKGGEGRVRGPGGGGQGG